MAEEIINLELDELSLVGKGANQYAKAPIFKSDISNGDVTKMTEDQKAELDKMSDAMKKKMKEYMEQKGMSYDKAKAMCNEEMRKSYEEENERLRKALIDNGFVIKSDTIEKKAAEEFIEFEGEQVAKSDIPAPVLKALEEAEAKEREAKLEKRANEELPHWDQEVAKGILKFDLDDKILEALKAADAAFEAVMTEKGESDVDGDMSDPAKALEKRQKELMEEKGLTKEAAMAELAKSKEGRDLINKAYYEKG